MPAQMPPDKMPYLPIFLDLRERLCLVLGGGEAACAKIMLLRRASGRVRVVADDLVAPLRDWAAVDEIEWRTVAEAASLDGVALIVDATPDAGWTASLLAEARTRGIPINTVDRPDACDFIFPALLDRSPVMVAISTGGTAPALARWLRQKLETAISPGVGRLAQVCGQWREQVRRRLPGVAARQRFWDDVLDGQAAQAIHSSNTAAIELEFARALDRSQDDRDQSSGSVDLVGAGPGAVDLLSLRAAAAIRRADVILYDRLVGNDILALARREATLIETGKRAGGHSVAQAEINDQLLAHARAGKRVVRLKGGDPFVFGRGGEEMLFLRRHGVEVRVVPGITAALGCAASLGVPLTHRGVERALHIVTAHRCAGDAADLPDWARLVKAHGTLAIYMGRDRAGDVSRQLIAAGLRADTPAVAIEDGTLSTERHCFATLGSLPAAMAGFNPAGPTILIVGQVVDLAPAIGALAVAAE